MAEAIIKKDDAEKDHVLADIRTNGKLDGDKPCFIDQFSNNKVAKTARKNLQAIYIDYLIEQ